MQEELYENERLNDASVILKTVEVPVSFLIPDI